MTIGDSVYAQWLLKSKTPPDKKRYIGLAVKRHVHRTVCWNNDLGATAYRSQTLLLFLLGNMTLARYDNVVQTNLLSSLNGRPHDIFHLDVCLYIVCLQDAGVNFYCDHSVHRI